VLDDVKVCRFPSVAEFLRYEVLASPLAEPVGRLDPEARDALVADLEDLLAAYVDDDGLALPAESYVVLATNGLRTGEVQGADVEGKRGPGRR
jgi:hypothetical protein